MRGDMFGVRGVSATPLQSYTILKTLHNYILQQQEVEWKMSMTAFNIKFLFHIIGIICFVLLSSSCE